MQSRLQIHKLAGKDNFIYCKIMSVNVTKATGPFLFPSVPTHVLSHASKLDSLHTFTFLSQLTIHVLWCTDMSMIQPCFPSRH